MKKDALPREDDDGSSIEALYGVLRRMAAVRMRGERRGHTLQPTALVHEVYLRLAGANAVVTKDRVHLLAKAAVAMRCILADHGRRRNAAKRADGAARVTLSGLALADNRSASLGGGVDPVDLDLALQRLEKVDPVAYQVFVLRELGGLTEEDVVNELGVSRSTVTRKWGAACRSMKHDLRDAR